MIRNKVHILSALLAAVLLSAGCRKDVPAPYNLSGMPLLFATPQVDAATKDELHSSMGTAYDTGESFMVYAAYSEGAFDPSDPSGYIAFWPGAMKCSYSATYNGWQPVDPFYWPYAGKLSFRAYSPADGTAPDAFSWTDGFTFTDFTVPAAGLQYDLLYSSLVADCSRSDYTLIDGNGYDDDPDYEYAYNGVNLRFHHALSLIEVQACSALGSYSSFKYYIQKVEIKNAFRTGTFTSGDGEWSGIDTSDKVDYTILDLSGKAAPEDRWQALPGSDEYLVSVNPGVTLMLLPQELDRTSTPAFDADVDAYLTITYKEGSDGASQTTTIPLPDVWERGKKYTYRLIFSSYIEFSAIISPWDETVTGSYLIVQ